MECGKESITTPQEYYNCPAVQKRLAEYCGGQTVDPESFTTEYLSGMSETLKLDRFSEEYFFSTSRSSFFWLLEQGVDLFRAAWDRDATIGLLDVEYFSLTYPGEAYFNPERIFTLMEPLYRRIQRTFHRFGIQPLAIMTGQGYHFVFKVNFASRVHAHLIELGRIEKSLITKYNSPNGRRTRPVPLGVGFAFDGMGRLLEYLAHLLVRDMGEHCNGIPVVCTDTAVGGKREAIALDLSMYGDPLYTRDIRCPFSTYQKHKLLIGKFGERAAAEIPVLVTLPRSGSMKLQRLLRLRQDLAASQKFAATAENRIPESSAGVKNLMRAYRASKLYKFHRYFDSTEHDRPDSWPATYDRFDLGAIPPCAGYCLRFPNDNILKPTNLQTLVRVLMKQGWHPKHIAGLVRSKLERDHGWGRQWVRYDPATRANFYVRLFAGLLATGLDREIDLNCLSHAEKGYCLQPHCGFNLTDFKL